MKLYPDLPRRRLVGVARDALVVLLVALFALLGLRVHDDVDRLAALGRGVRDTGGAIERGFATAAESVEGVPVVGGRVAGGLRDAGAGSGGELEALGREGEDAAHRLADLLGLLVFGLPTAVLLARMVPARIEEVRRLTAASQVLAEPGALERRRLVAMRAAFSLPYGQLLEYTRDPLGDLAAERYDPLVAAALEDAGLRPRSPS